MSAASSDPPEAAVRGCLAEPSRRTEILGWLLIAAVVIGLRWLAATYVPTYVWTRDSGSYLAPAVDWLQSGRWVTSARRGPIYSLFIAAILKSGGTLLTVVNVQAVIGAITAALTLWMARVWLGRWAFWPLWVCALFYALYGMPVELERLVRNETLLTLFATVAFGAWRFALRRDSLAWIGVSGLASGLMQLLKGIFPLYPLIVVSLVIWNWRGHPRRALILSGCYLALFVLPLASSKIYTRLSHTARPPEPEDGEMFYGRTAQWTYLDGGLAPDIKARIYEQARAYGDRFRRTGKLENNEIVKRTVVPTLKTILVDERGKTLVDVNRFCWRLGLEAVAHHPLAYVRQVIHDLYFLNFISAQRFVVFLPKQLTASAADAAKYCDVHPDDDATLTRRIFDLPGLRAAVDHAAAKHSSLGRLSRFVTIIGRLRLLSPVFLTTLALPWLVYRCRGRERSFWLGSAVLWFYYLLLLSTVGRPLDRYLMPVLPIMFWAISTTFVPQFYGGLRKLRQVFFQRSL